MEQLQDEPEDRDDDHPDDEGHAAVVIEDSDGALASLDLETGELAEV
jgi:single-strand DNA-binding protein